MNANTFTLEGLRAEQTSIKTNRRKKARTKVRTELVLAIMVINNDKKMEQLLEYPCE